MLINYLKKQPRGVPKMALSEPTGSLRRHGRALSCGLDLIRYVWDLNCSGVCVCVCACVSAPPELLFNQCADVMIVFLIIIKTPFPPTTHFLFLSVHWLRLTAVFNQWQLVSSSEAFIQQWGLSLPSHRRAAGQVFQVIMVQITKSVLGSVPKSALFFSSKVEYQQCLEQFLKRTESLFIFGWDQFSFKRSRQLVHIYW